MRTLTIALSLLALTTGASCGKNDDSSSPSSRAAPATVPAVSAPATVAPAPSATASAKAAQKVELSIASVANTMTYDKTTLTVPAGAEVHLTLKNNATMSTLPHNWVLLAKSGTEAGVAAAGLKMGEPAGYIDVRDKDILAFTPQAKPGESSEVTFTAPAAGTYPYICTTPGHYLMMKGVLTVTP